jgi:CheY-like chemotaxis protein
LDINLNRGESGLDFLAWLRAQEGLLGSTPALVLTGSEHPRDLLIADRLRVMRYLTKPVGHEQLVEAVQSLGLRFATNLATGDVGFRLLERI